MKGKKVSAEACALERVVSAAREVQAASLRLEAHYAEHPNELPSTLELARFAAAMQELKNAREAFDTLVEKRHLTPT
jgi:cytochrome c-type biogenesis protein CcmH/NrfG